MVPLIARYPGPVYLRISRNDLPKIFDDSYKVEIGKGVTVRGGKDVTIITCGHMLVRSLDAADKLKDEGIDAGIVNIHTVKPLDVSLILKCAEKTGALVTAEEHSIVGGLGGAVAEKVAME
jgi:transketolase